MKERLSKIEKQEDIRISVENVNTDIRKMTNWKLFGPDCVQGCCFKRFSTLHSRLTEHLQTCVVVDNVPMDDKRKNNIDLERSRERKCYQQLPPYRMSTTYVEVAH